MAFDPAGYNPSIPGMGIPDDSRLKGYGKRVTHPTLPLERAYCSRCGKPYGYVSYESSNLIRSGQVIVFCEDCEQGMKKLGGVPLKVATVS